MINEYIFVILADNRICQNQLYLARYAHIQGICTPLAGVSSPYI